MSVDGTSWSEQPDPRWPFVRLDYVEMGWWYSGENDGTIAAIDADLAKVRSDRLNPSWHGRVRKGNEIDPLTIDGSDGDRRRSSRPETIRVKFERLFDKADRMESEAIGNSLAKLSWQLLHE